MDIFDIFSDYQNLPEYSGVALRDVNQVSLFGDRPIHVAATRGAIEELDVLFSHGARLNDGGDHGYTPLHDAVEQGKLAAVLWLLAHGADISISNEDGRTPIQLAQILGEAEIESALPGC